MSESYKVIQVVGEEPVTLEDAKLHLRYESGFTANDAAISAYISAARAFCENQLDMAIVKQTMQHARDGFPSARSFELPRTALISVQSVTYVLDGSEATLPTADYLVDDYSTPGAVYLPGGKTWPATDSQRNSVVVSYTAGIAVDTSADYPPEIKEAMLLLIGHYDSNREAAVTGTISSELQLGVDRILQPLRRLGL